MELLIIVAALLMLFVIARDVQDGYRRFKEHGIKEAVVTYDTELAVIICITVAIACAGYGFVFM